MGMKFKAGKYSAAQKKWCEMYERETGFEPLMCDYEAGNEEFRIAAKKSNRWFESWSSDALLHITQDDPPGTPDTWMGEMGRTTSGAIGQP